MATKKTKKPAPQEPEEVDDAVVDDEEDDDDSELFEPQETVSMATLERTTDRVVKLLNGTAANGEIRFRMGLRGWKPAAAAEGRKLLSAVLDPTPFQEEALRKKKIQSSDKKVADAVASLDALDEGHFAIAKTTLFHNFRVQHDFVFFELAPSTGTDAVNGWSKFLTRIRALRSAPERKETRKADHEALALLAERGLDQAELDRLEGLLRIAEGGEATDAFAEEFEDDERRTRLLALRSWFQQWITVARVQIKRRDLRIRIGIGKRRSPKSAKAKKPGNDPKPV